MAKRLNPNSKLEDSILTLHFQAPTTPQEQEALQELECKGEYRKTLARTRKVAEWYYKAKLLDEMNAID